MVPFEAKGAPGATELPKTLEPPRRQFGVPRRILNIAMPEIGLDRTRVVAIVGELVAAGTVLLLDKQSEF